MFSTIVTLLSWNLLALPVSYGYAVKEGLRESARLDNELAKRKSWLSPPYTWLFQFPLPIPSVKTPKM